MYPVWSKRWNTATGWPVVSPTIFWNESVERWNSSSLAAMPLEEVHRIKFDSPGASAQKDSQASQAL
jgi:hypothetical protein